MTPTQVRRPWRATLRTAFAALVALAAMAPMLDRLRALLSPATRRKLYMTLALVTGTLVTAGLVAPDVAEHWTGLVLAGFDALALVLATVNARRWNRAAIYATGAAVLSAVVGVGWLSDAQASQVRSVGGLLLGLAAVWLAAYRTDPDTPTGEPRDEYVGRHR